MNRLSTGHFYMTINYRGQEGIREALTMLRHFYLTFKEEEEKISVLDVVTTNDLVELKKMVANLPKREDIERSSVYVGYKLLWAIRLLLLGKKFPHGHFDHKSWQEITHEVLDVITEEEFMKTL